MPSEEIQTERQERRRLLALPLDLEGLVRRGVLTQDGDWYHIVDRNKVPEHLWIRIAIDENERIEITSFRLSPAHATAVSGWTKRILNIGDEPVEFYLDDPSNVPLAVALDTPPPRAESPQWSLIGKSRTVATLLEGQARHSLDVYSEDELRELWGRKTPTGEP